MSDRTELEDDGVWVVAPLSGRLIAVVLDGFVASLLFLVAIPLQALGLVAVIIGLVVSLAYVVFGDSPFVPSAGKRVARLRVVDSKTWEPCSTGQAVLRNLLRFFPLDWFWLLDGAGQRLGDRVAGTRVVYQMVS